MAKSSPKTVFLCNQCGNEFPKWHGQCPACNEWGTLSEFRPPKTRRKTNGAPARETKKLSSITNKKGRKRSSSGLSEVNRVLGGGLLPGSMILLGGQPGIGKSTLALQVIAGCGQSALYVSAEESDDQLALRAERLGVQTTGLHVSGENEILNVLEQVSVVQPALLVIDSIQTVYNEDLDSLPGSVGQLRNCGQQLLNACKQKGFTVIVIGHVTKEGTIAGPKMLEHMVDTVLYLEGDDRYDHRILRSVKNRFGATNEVGVFQMTSLGLEEVTNPSELFLAERTENTAGTAIFPSMEGSRPILVEVQALVSKANFGTPQRNANGVDTRRLAMLLAVLEKRLGKIMGMNDVFVNLVGGLKIQDPAADLAIISALASSNLDKPIANNTVLVGEVGLTGEVRSVAKIEQRLQEAVALGFKIAIIPKSNMKNVKSFKGLKIHDVKSVREAFQHIF
ncbi:MAG TPA: DNA repair protein RadA [Candidatus Marinimicrobia bacterium]|jgi:DNA repair protein RadA/Sms|nr:DNA repair protein RadA [Candidatus Neomarinimicrobiota bacterium]MDP7217403.1 DNA repair protein RadA [Candidatus Neomarinimicrobiota bacterium]MDP7436576.1 DNA repair protein RadA [Candidatus Neomarinimicrobiota bacterium]HBN45558.1 DNA repair protein RadA [Candidatus Neomarinimicrobiota bacterium]HJL74099.1 DNA repair protein RadA [Candidatus Neomarinimicrobiota bacterium]|tara:strand:+ start:1374 stop:2726 length:1353 start_codon:yes stop_codon:yes gene_type:complete